MTAGAARVGNVAEAMKHIDLEVGQDHLEALAKLRKPILGIEELRHLHLYIAYQEKVLYVTAADAH